MADYCQPTKKLIYNRYNRTVKHIITRSIIKIKRTKSSFFKQAILAAKQLSHTVSKVEFFLCNK